MTTVQLWAQIWCNAHGAQLPPHHTTPAPCLGRQRQPLAGELKRTFPKQQILEQTPWLTRFVEAAVARRTHQAAAGHQVRLAAKTDTHYRRAGHSAARLGRRHAKKGVAEDGWPAEEGAAEQAPTTAEHLVHHVVHARKRIRRTSPAAAAPPLEHGFKSLSAALKSISRSAETLQTWLHLSARCALHGVQCQRRPQGCRRHRLRLHGGATPIESNRELQMWCVSHQLGHPSATICVLTCNSSHSKHSEPASRAALCAPGPPCSLARFRSQAVFYWSIARGYA